MLTLNVDVSITKAKSSQTVVLPVLEHCVLLGARRVIDGDVGDFSLSPQQVGTLSVDVHDRQWLVVLEGVEAPPALGDAGLWRLVVLDDHAPERVGVFRQRPRQLKVGLLFRGRRFLVASKLLLLGFFALLAVFPPPFVVLLSLSLLGREGIPLPRPVSAAVSIPWSVRFPPATPVPLLSVSPSALVTTASMLLPFLDFMFRDNRKQKAYLSAHKSSSAEFK